MAYHFETVKLEKGMYGRSGRTFSQTLEELDPSEHYRGTALEGLDAFQRQLKRFDIKVKGVGSDRVEKFFHSAESAVLFPEFVSRVVRQGTGGRLWSGQRRLYEGTGTGEAGCDRHPEQRRCDGD